MYVGDIVKANLAALRKGKNVATNIGWGKLITDQMIFDTIAKTLNYKQKVKYAPYRSGEVYRISLDAGKARSILGWKPTVTLEEGVRRTLATL